MRSEKELAAGLREVLTINLSGNPVEEAQKIRRMMVERAEAADYIERTAAPSDGLNEDDAADLQEGRPYQDVLAAKRTAPPADGLPEFETTAEERAQYSAMAARAAEAWADKTRSITDRVARTAFMVDGDFLHRLFRDLDKAIAFAASETKRADEALAADLVHQQSAAGEIASLNELIRAGRAVCDREAAARRVAEALSRTIREELARQVHEKHAAEDRAEQAEAREATLRAALEAIDVDVKALRAAASRGPVSSREVFSLTDPIADKIARAALATTSTGEGS